jgi:hypothetical protein
LIGLKISQHPRSAQSPRNKPTGDRVFEPSVHEHGLRRSVNELDKYGDEAQRRVFAKAMERLGEDVVRRRLASRQPSGDHPDEDPLVVAILWLNERRARARGRTNDDADSCLDRHSLGGGRVRGGARASLMELVHSYF